MVHDSPSGADAPGYAPITPTFTIRLSDLATEYTDALQAAIIQARDDAARLLELFGDPHDGQVWSDGVAQQLRQAASAPTGGWLDDGSPMAGAPVHIPSRLPYAPMPELDMDITVAPGEPPLPNMHGLSAIVDSLRGQWKNLVEHVSTQAELDHGWAQVLARHAQYLPGPAKRARMLLRKTLSPDAWAQYCRDQYIDVTSSASGFIYRIYQIPSPVQRVGFMYYEANIASLCCAPQDGYLMPWEDVLLLQWIALSFDERRWVHTANVIWDQICSRPEPVVDQLHRALRVRHYLPDDDPMRDEVML